MKNIVCLLFGLMTLGGLRPTSLQAATNPLPEGYADIVGSVVPVHYQSSNNKQNIVGTWITHDGHVWAMLLVNADEYRHNYDVDVSINGMFHTNLNFQADYRTPSELEPLPGLELSAGDGKALYYYPLDITTANGVEFGTAAQVFLDCVQVGGGHDVGGTATPVIPPDCTLLTVLCHYGAVRTVVEKMLFEIAPETQDEWPRGLDRPDGEWRLERATVNDVATPTFTNADGCTGTVRFTPVKGAVTSIEYFYVFVPQVVSLWITDHCDAGDGLIHLAFKPTLDDGSIPTEEWIRHLHAGNRFKVKWADAWSGLESAAHVDIVALRNGTGAQDIGKGWVWITVKTPDGADGHDVDGAGLALKIVILPSAET